MQLLPWFWPRYEIQCVLCSVHLVEHERGGVEGPSRPVPDGSLAGEVFRRYCAPEAHAAPTSYRGCCGHPSLHRGVNEVHDYLRA